MSAAHSAFLLQLWSSSGAVECHTKDHDNTQVFPFSSFPDSTDSVPGEVMQEIRSEAKQPYCQFRGTKAKDNT